MQLQQRQRQQHFTQQLARAKILKEAALLSIRLKWSSKRAELNPLLLYTLSVLLLLGPDSIIMKVGS